MGTIDDLFRPEAKLSPIAVRIIREAIGQLLRREVAFVLETTYLNEEERFKAQLAYNASIEKDLGRVLPEINNGYGQLYRDVGEYVINVVLPGIRCFSGKAYERITAWTCAIMGRVYEADIQYQLSKNPGVFRPVLKRFEEFYGLKLSHIDFNLDVLSENLEKIIEMKKRTARRNGLVG